MEDIKTFDYSENGYNNDPLYRKQKEGVSKMRASLLASSDNGSMMGAIQDITVMRIYHQLARIIRYTELIDKLEDKLYEGINFALDTTDASDPSVWLMLMKTQKQLQETMIESQKLIDPYITMLQNSEKFVNAVQTVEPAESDIIDARKRDNIRIAARSVLNELDQLESNQDETSDSDD